MNGAVAGGLLRTKPGEIRGGLAVTMQCALAHGSGISRSRSRVHRKGPTTRTPP